MARALLRWSLTDLARAANVGRATAARFELGEGVGDGPLSAMRAALELAGAGLIDSGQYTGGVYHGRKM